MHLTQTRINPHELLNCLLQSHVSNHSLMNPDQPGQFCLVDLNQSPPPWRGEIKSKEQSPTGNIQQDLSVVIYMRSLCLSVTFQWSRAVWRRGRRP